MEANLNTQGLSSLQAKQQLKIFGKNEISTSTSMARAQQVVDILSDPMGIMMLSLAFLYFLTGNHSDATIMLIAYIPVTGVDVLLKIRSETALKALRSKLQVSAKVFRDGVITEVPINQIVPGDVLIFEEGQSLPADGTVLEAQNLSINEAALTGESIPVENH